MSRQLCKMTEATLSAKMQLPWPLRTSHLVPQANSLESHIINLLPRAYMRLSAVALNDYLLSSGLEAQWPSGY